MDVGLNSHSSELPQNNYVSIIAECKFVNNSAKLSGGTTIYSTRSSSDNSNHIKFIKCVREKNHANYGSAIDIVPCS